MKMLKLASAALLALSLTGCFLTPGKFASSIDLRRDGSFTVAYQGEVIFQPPDEMMGEKKEPKPWADTMAICYKSGRKYADEWALESAATDLAAEGDEKTANAPKPGPEEPAGEEDPDATRRDCTKKEVAELKAEFEKNQKERADKQKRDRENMAMLFGFGSPDDAGNKKFAAAIMKQEGWKSVVYKGEGVFDVDYRFSGKVGHDFVFPIFPQSDIIIPFIMLRKRGDGSVAVSTPALIGGGLKALGERARAMGMPDSKDMPTSPRTQGVLTVTTDGEILTNNTEDGPVSGTAGKTLTWQIDPGTSKVPEALIRLK
jgi:hypothetical protein